MYNTNIIKKLSLFQIKKNNFYLHSNKGFISFVRLLILWSKTMMNRLRKVFSIVMIGLAVALFMFLCYVGFVIAYVIDQDLMSR